MNTEMSPERFAQLHPRIQQKILSARAAAEGREQKKEDRQTLKDWLRHEELRAIPIAQRTQEEKNEYQRMRRRLAEHEEEAMVAINERMTKEQFWELNRASAATRKIGPWRERQERVLDILAWFDRLDEGTETPEHCGENFVSVEEGTQDILDDIAEHSTTRLGYIYANEDVPTDCWSGFSGRAFWRVPEVFRWLCEENEPTRVYATTGICIALPDWRVVEFLTRHCGWKPRQAQEQVGWKFSNSTTRVRYE